MEEEKVVSKHDLIHEKLGNLRKFVSLLVQPLLEKHLTSEALSYVNKLSEDGANKFDSLAKDEEQMKGIISRIGQFVFLITAAKVWLLETEEQRQNARQQFTMRVMPFINLFVQGWKRETEARYEKEQSELEKEEEEEDQDEKEPGSTSKSFLWEVEQRPFMEDLLQVVLGDETNVLKFIRYANLFTELLVEKPEFIA